MKIPSEYLSASAGSGKTFALSKRFCHLVMSRVAPDEICALTFTRAATREIFAAIIERLTSEKNELGTIEQGLTREAALSQILNALPRLQISTIDAFSSMIARLFAYDIGLNPDFALYEGGGQSPEAQAVLQESVQRALQCTPQQSEKELLELYNFQHGTEAEIDSLSARLQTYLERFEALLESHPEGWGEVSALELDATELHRCPNLAQVAEEVEQHFEILAQAKLFKPKSEEKLRKLLKGYHAEIHSVRELNKQWTREGWDGLKRLPNIVKTGEFKFGNSKPTTLPPTMVSGIDAMLSDVLARDVEQTAKHTQALHRALVAIKKAKDALTEELGLLSFDALTKTLAKQVGGQLSVRDAKAFYIAYRLDSAIRHLMIDEFQDTSVNQWQILSGMAHELAPAESDGTFFYVGDVKQSIYGWRGGDATLFGDTTRLPAIAEGAPLLVSYRSCPTVINLINDLMPLPFTTDANGNPPEPWQAPIVETWRGQWKAHHSAEKRAQQTGYVRMITLEGTEKNEETGRLIDTKTIHRQEIARLIAERWQQLRGKALTMAVLASTNAVLQDEDGLLHYLRKLGVPCALEGKLKVADTPMGSVVVALLHWMADPRATLWQQVATALGLDEAEEGNLLNRWMACVHEKGFVAWLDSLFGVQTAWFARLTESDKRSLEAIRQGLEQLDQQRCVDPAVARDTIDTLQVPSIADKNVLNLMTIHQSKGLTFSVVFTVIAGDIVRAQSDEPTVGEDWVMERCTFSETFDAVPALKTARETAYAHRMQDVLCALYVAITRAEREQVIFAPKKDTKSLKHTAAWLFTSKLPQEAPQTRSSKKAKGDVNPSVVHHAFDGEAPSEPEKVPHQVVFEDGDPDWWKSLNDHTKATDEAQPDLQITWKREDAKSETVEVELPSEHAKARTVAEILVKTSTKARDFGIDLHERLAQIEWAEEGCYGVPAEVFKRPDEPCELWRERPFSVQLPQEAGAGFRYLPGQFDRVHLFPNSKRAIIYDYKTAYKAEVTPAYARQLKDYRMALSVLTGYPVEAIQMKLVFTRHQCIMDVEP